ncbi:hypothetical protein ACQJBY_041073 [Aegilops geniculata]
MSQNIVFEELPQDIVHRIHSLLPVQEAARAACASRGLLHSWRCYSNLTLNCETLGLTHKKFEERETYIIDKVDKILRNHYGNGVKVKTLKLHLAPCNNIKAACLDGWLQVTVKAGIKELDLAMPLLMKEKYNFPCSVLSDDAAASSIQSLGLWGCSFHPTSTLGLLRRLKCLQLTLVDISEEGLGLLLSKSSSLEQLVLFFCSGITCLQIPCTMQQLNFLSITECKSLKMVEIDAPNLCSFYCVGTLIEISIRNSFQLKNVNLSCILLSDARAKLPSILGTVESLTLRSRTENAKVPTLASKLPCLKHLDIELLGPTMAFPPFRSITDFPKSYDVFSLVSFLDASPTLHSFILRVEQGALRSDFGFGDDHEYLRQRPEGRHNCLRQVTITGFCPSKSLVQLLIYILESAPSLERLTLDTTYRYDRRSGTTSRWSSSRKIGQCSPMCRTYLPGARRAVEAACRCIAGRVPPNVEFEVLEMCSRCHDTCLHI